MKVTPLLLAHKVIKILEIFKYEKLHEAEKFSSPKRRLQAHLKVKIVRYWKYCRLKDKVSLIYMKATMLLIKMSKASNTFKANDHVMPMSL